MKKPKIIKSLKLKDELFDNLITLSLRERRSLSWIINDILRNSLGLKPLIEGMPKKRSNRQVSIALNVDVIDEIRVKSCKKQLNSTDYIIDILNKELNLNT